MADQNPIKYSDLIAPDDSINNLIAQLEKLDKIYGDLVNSAQQRAKDLLASVTKISGATKEGRDATMEMADATASLGKAVKITKEVADENAQKIEMLKEKARQEANEEKRIMKLKVEQSRALAGSYNALSAQYRQNKIVLNALTEEMRKNDPAAKKLEEETRAIYEKMNELQKATGKYQLQVGRYTESIQEAIGANSKWFKMMENLGGLFQGGFSAGIKRAGAAVGAFGKQLLALLANPIVATIAAIAAAFTALAKGISSSEENSESLMRILAPFQRILTGVVNVLQTMAGWLLKGVEGLEGMAMSASKMMERLPLVGDAIRKVNKALEDNIELTKRKIALEDNERDQSVKTSQIRKNIAKWENDASKTNDPKRRIQLYQMAERERKRLLYDEIALAKEAVAIAEEEAKQSQNSEEANDKKAQAYVRLNQAYENYYRETTKLNKKILKEENGIESAKEKAAEKAKKEAEKRAREEEQRKRKEEEKYKKNLEAIRKSEDVKVDSIENPYDKQRAQIQLAYEREVEDTKHLLQKEEDLTIEAKEKLIQKLVWLEEKKYKELADVADKQMKEAIEAETRDYNKRIQAADKLVKQKKDKDEKEKEQRKLIRKTIQDDTEFALESLSQLMEGYLRAAEAKRQLADEEVDRAQRVLDAEIQARNEGYAYDVMSAQKELDLARRNQQKAIEEERRAQQAKEAIDTATQVSSLITATANIWSSFSGIGPWGIPLAIASIALMWGSFAASKVMAHQTAGSGTEEYGEGTVELLDGGSHQSGNDIDLGRKKDGTRRRAEGGEYFAVINKRNSRKYRNLIPEVINALNDGTFAEKYMGAYGNTGVNVNVGGTPDLSILQGDVRRIREQGESNSFTDGNGNTVMQYKNLRRLIRK